MEHDRRTDHAPLRGNGIAYQGINVVMLWSEVMEKGFSSPVWMTFKQASELNAHVRKGKRGSLVVYAEKMIRSETDSESGETNEYTIPFMKEGVDVARCTVPRLMQDMGLQGVIRGKSIKTTISNRAPPCPLDHVNRQFKAPRPNALWLSRFTYVATWSGLVYVAFVIDAYARRILGWRASRTAHANFVLDAL